MLSGVAPSFSRRFSNAVVGAPPASNATFAGISLTETRLSAARAATPGIDTASRRGVA
jgi:hypothetical protein